MNPPRRWGLFLAIALAPLGFWPLPAQPADAGGRERDSSRPPPQASASLAVPDEAVDVVLARPTTTSITVSLRSRNASDGSIAFGEAGTELRRETPRRSLAAGEPGEFVLEGLRPDTAYRYEARLTDGTVASGRFHTARPPGSAFTFTVTADSHLDSQTDGELYRRTLDSAAAAAPDFHVDLGDTFMTEKHRARGDATRQYLAQRFYLGRIGRNAPLFLVLGNHDGEFPRGSGPDPAGTAIWAHAMRTRYFPNPLPGGFYSGNTNRHPEAGYLQDYYAWEWGDALGIVLDPYWYSGGSRRGRGVWDWTLGPEQFHWLDRTLANSRARFRFVFLHQLVPGADSQGRGGVEAAGRGEWGGRDDDGSDSFAVHRPGWSEPLHALFVRHRVAIVFHGHDHFYARQKRDGIVYQLVPQPGHPGASRPPRSAGEYGYQSGVLLGGSGYLRVTVSAEEVGVEFRRPNPDAAGEVTADSYRLPDEAPPR